MAKNLERYADNEIRHRLDPLLEMGLGAFLTRETAHSRCLTDVIERQYPKSRVKWVSSKSTDGLAATSIGLPLAITSIIGDQIRHPSVENHSSLELIGDLRRNYDRFNPSAIPQTHLHAWMSDLLQPGSRLLVPFANSRLLSDIAIADSKVKLLTNPLWLQMALEHKPWTEQLLRSFDIPVLPWLHASTKEGLLKLVERFSDDELLVVREPEGTGGLGHTLVSTKELREMSEIGPPWVGLTSVCAFLPVQANINVSGCVTRSGYVNAHLPSLQIIGEAACDAKPFAYCGNQFGPLGNYLLAEHIAALETIVNRSGTAIASQGYIGVFGLDLLLYEGQIAVSELNPRFQASSAACSRLLNQLGLPTVHEDHIAAFLNVELTNSRPPMREMMAALDSFAQLFAYGSGTISERDEDFPPLSDRLGLDLLQVASKVEQNALRYRMSVQRHILDDRGRLESKFSKLVCMMSRVTRLQDC